VSHSYTKPAVRKWNIHTENSFFSLYGAVVRTLTQDGLAEEAKEFKERAKALKGDEERLLALAREFVEF
jgi:hypothetical protein